MAFDYERQATKSPEKQKLAPASPDEHAAVKAAFKAHYVASLMPAVRERVLAAGWPEELVLDVAHRINSGLGSLGMPRYYVLLDHRANMHAGEGQVSTLHGEIGLPQLVSERSLCLR